MAEGDMVCEGHLGGYVKGGDSATYYPELWQWLIDHYGIKSMVDVGCGEGHALEYFQHHHVSGTGVDGMPQESLSIIQHDYTKAALVFGKHEFDLCWSCEFVEHVEEEFLPNVLATFGCAKMVAITHAWPGQAGYHHVNCKTPHYWIGAMAAIGYRLDEAITEHARVVAGLNPSPWNHFKRSGLIFLRR
jgi:hypothetical protein